MKRHYRSASPYEAQIGFSRAVRHGDRIVVSGTGAELRDDVSIQKAYLGI